MATARPTALLAAGLAMATGCDALDDFEETFEDVIVIPGARPAGTPFTSSYEGALSSLDLSSSRGFREAGVSPSDVDSIRAARGALSIDLGNPQLNDLSVYVASMTLFVRSDNQAPVVLAEVDDPPMAAAMALPLDTTVELKPYAVDSGMRFDAELTLAVEPALPVRLTTSITLAIDVNLLGT